MKCFNLFSLATFFFITLPSYAETTTVDKSLKIYNIENFGLNLEKYQALPNPKLYGGDLQKGVVEDLEDSLCDAIYTEMTGSRDYHDDDYEELIEGACEQGTFTVKSEKRSENLLKSELTIIKLKVENDGPIGSEMKTVGNNGFECTVEIQRRIDSEISIDDNGDVSLILKARNPLNYVTFESNPKANFYEIEVLNAWKLTNFECKYNNQKK